MSAQIDHSFQRNRVDLAEMIVSPDAVSCVSESGARHFNIVPLALLNPQSTDKVLVIAAAEDIEVEQRQRICRYLGLQCTLKIVRADAQLIQSSLDKCYRFEHRLSALLSEVSGHALPLNGHKMDSEHLMHLLEALMLKACRERASDIHLTPGNHDLIVRFRIDGVLQKIAVLPDTLISNFTVRLKVMAGLDIAETRLPQDGQYRQLLDARGVEFRISTFPTVSGENIVLRLIDETCSITFDSLSLSSDMRSLILQAVHQPGGLVIVCGPTGCGKTSTLFALLKQKDLRALNVMTLEDPVEHVVSGITQTSIDPGRAFDYSQGVRSLLRQDPDVLMIGEIRDVDSCEMALRAVTTGHQVFSTVHADSAHAALTRLRELGAPPQLLSESLTVIIAQRLVRQLCQSCKGNDKRCRCCRGAGYAGRRAILEILLIDDELATLIAQNSQTVAIEQVSKARGFTEMYTQAKHLVDKGLLDDAELVRVFGTRAENLNRVSSMNEVL